MAREARPRSHGRQDPQGEVRAWVPRCVGLDPAGQNGGHTGLEAGMPAAPCPVFSVLSALNILLLSSKVQFTGCMAYEVGTM